MGKQYLIDNVQNTADGDIAQAVIDCLHSRGQLSDDQIAYLKAYSGLYDIPIDLHAVRAGFVSARDTQIALAEVTGLSFVDEDVFGAMEVCLDGCDPGELIRHALLPCRRASGDLLVIMARPMSYDSPFADRFSSCETALGTREAIEARLVEVARGELRTRACVRTEAAFSCRGWQKPSSLLLTALALCLVAILTAVLFWSEAAFFILVILAMGTLLTSLSLKTGASLASLRRPDLPLNDFVRNPVLPRVSIMVPMFREGQMAVQLAERLSKLSYPKALLDILFVLEEVDEETLHELARADLPDWMRIIVAPDGEPRTKPRAMNYALNFCQGSIIGVYDAEDAPVEDQLERVAEAFSHLPDEVACLQGILDFYNPRQNWLARCFTIEYATWFRMILPGFDRLGFAIPLGGTTFFIKRDALEVIGAWDAHNVTEDADLGFRLERFGYKTKTIAVVTEEEANCHIWPWIKQRSRWLKGYAMTYICHMRAPRALWRDLGSWRFLGLQAHFLSALFQFILGPVLWSFWLKLVFGWHPLNGVLSEATFVVLGLFFLLAEVLNMLTYMLALSQEKHRHLVPFTPFMHIYWSISGLAALKAIYELLLKPYFWDKTQHGISQQQASTAHD